MSFLKPCCVKSEVLRLLKRLFLTSSLVLRLLRLRREDPALSYVRYAGKPVSDKRDIYVVIHECFRVDEIGLTLLGKNITGLSATLSTGVDEPFEITQV